MRRAPLHWTNLFGVVAFACVVVLFVTGFILMFAYTPSSERVTYQRSVLPLAGRRACRRPCSRPWRSRSSFPAVCWCGRRTTGRRCCCRRRSSCSSLVTFFTGAFRRPRRLSWLLLFGLLLTALVGGWSGYALPDDMLSGTGLRIVEGIVLGIPVIGTWLSALLFGGEFPGRIIENLYPIHVAVVPVLLVVLIALRARIAYVNKPAQFAGAGRSEDVIVGVPLWPNAAVRAGGLFAIVTGGSAARRGDRHDQPDLAVRPVVAGRCLRRQPARLVHRLPRRRAPARPARVGGGVAGPDLDPGDPRAARRRRAVPPRGGGLPVRGGVGHGRPRRPPHPGPPAQRADAHRTRRRRPRVLRRPLGSRQRGPRRDALPPHRRVRRRDLPGAGRAGTDRRLLDHAARLPRAAEARPRHPVARVRDRADRPAAGRRVRRGARAGGCGRAVPAGRSGRGPRRGRASRRGWPAAAHAAAPRCAVEDLFRGPARTGR